MTTMARRRFLSLTAVGGGAVFASASPGCADLAGVHKVCAADFDRPGCYVLLCDNISGDG